MSPPSLAALFLLVFAGPQLPHAPLQAAQAQVQTQVQPAQPDLTLPLCGGVLKQGGLIVCRGLPGMVFTTDDGRRQTAEATGIVTFGLSRTAPERTEIAYDIPASVMAPGIESAIETLPIAPRTDEVRNLTGLDCDKLDARTDEQQAHAARSRQAKGAAFATFTPGLSLPAEWLVPAEGRPSSPFGPTRTYSGVSEITGEPCSSVSTHQGYDIAAPVGTDIIAPAAGVVILADPDLYYEGGTVFLDHGHGLISVFMHMSSVDVEPGQYVAAGERIGATGNTGRTTGPHLHWAVKWRDIGSDDRSRDFYIDPALLLDWPD